MGPVGRRALVRYVECQFDTLDVTRDDDGTDRDFIDFFARCKQNLLPNGVIVLKENNSANGFVVDKTDSSVTR